MFQEAEATINSPIDLTTEDDKSSILQTAQTKWPTIELKWKSGHTPSLN